MTGIFYVLTAVTRGWNGYRNKIPGRKLTPEGKKERKKEKKKKEKKKGGGGGGGNPLLPLLPGFEPATFRFRVRHSNC